MNPILSLCRAIILITSTAFSCITYAEHKTIGIIVPLEHSAMNQIVSGIQESLADMNVTIDVKNAHSDPNLMLSIIKQMKDSDVDLIMPIGTSTSQMTLSHIKTKPVICVGAIIDNSSQLIATGLNDEIPITASISRMPILSNIAVIYSASEKIAPEIDELKAYAKKHDIALHLSMVQSLVDMPLAVQNAPQDVQCFLILKDHLVVSGISILSKEALKRGIPVIASDEGSVSGGATIAIGIKEKDIGIESGLIAKEILQGKKPSEIPYKTMRKLVIFTNEESFKNQNILTEDDIKVFEMEIVKY